MSHDEAERTSREEWWHPALVLGSFGQNLNSIKRNGSESGGRFSATFMRAEPC